MALFILIIGGFLGIVTKTGAIDAGIETRHHPAARPRRVDDPGSWMALLLPRAADLRHGRRVAALLPYTLLVPVMLAARLIRWLRPLPCCSARIENPRLHHQPVRTIAANAAEDPLHQRHHVAHRCW